MVSNMVAKEIKYAIDTLWINEANVYPELKTTYWSHNLEHHDFDIVDSLKMVGVGSDRSLPKGTRVVLKRSSTAIHNEIMLKLLKKFDNDTTRGDLISQTLYLQNSAR